METVDVIVIGSGQGGVPFAVDYANAGQKVVLFERDALGGSCVNYGCTPSKAFLAAAHAAGRSHQAANLGIHAQIEAQQQGINAREVTTQVAQTSRGIEWGQDLGFFRMVIDTQTNLILGATLVGYETAELVHVLLALMEAGATWQVLERSVYIHPT